jgi:hypothetical protein
VIRDALTSKGAEAITSDRWHVVHSRFTPGSGKLRFVRGISSEHPDRADCLRAARALAQQLATQSGSVPATERDEVFVRRPNFKSLKRARHRRSGRR